jgi:phosphatidylserine/phosphatidylglycerophosphate/cardiolipin synthase-like enzyme
VRVGFILHCSQATFTNVYKAEALWLLGRHEEARAAARIGRMNVAPESYRGTNTLIVGIVLWHKDMTGTLLFEALRAAANRGVRVRLLLDDNRTSGLDTTLAALDAHPNIDVRLFNPFVIRKPRVIGFITDFSRWESDLTIQHNGHREANVSRFGGACSTARDVR